MLQRAALAAALACGPELLILDEPTTALDATVQAEVLALLSELKKSRDMAMLLITHDFGVAARLADQLAVMYAGKLVESGSAREVLYDPRHPYTWALLACLPGARVLPGKGAQSVREADCLEGGKDILRVQAGLGAAEDVRSALEQGGAAALCDFLLQARLAEQNSSPVFGGQERGSAAPGQRCTQPAQARGGAGKPEGERRKIPYLPGNAPDLPHWPAGDAFAPRNAYALAIEQEEAPPAFWVSETHWAATWLLHPSAPRIAPPVYVRDGEVLIEEGYRGR